jgi:hypothetical protein
MLFVLFCLSVQLLHTRWQCYHGWPVIRLSGSGQLPHHSYVHWLFVYRDCVCVAVVSETETVYTLRTERHPRPLSTVPRVSQLWAVRIWLACRQLRDLGLRSMNEQVCPSSVFHDVGVVWCGVVWWCECFVLMLLVTLDRLLPTVHPTF